MVNPIECPYCAEEIKSEAKICKHCNKKLTTFDAKQKIKQQIKKQELLLSKEKQETERLKIIKQNNSKIELYPEKYRKKIKKDIKFLSKLESMTKEDIEKDIFKRDRKRAINLLWLATIILGFISPFVYLISIWLHPNKEEKVLLINRLKEPKKYYIRIIISIFVFLIALSFDAFKSEEAEKERIKIQQEEKEKSTQLSWNFSINEELTTAEEISITLSLSNISELNINDVDVEITDENIITHQIGLEEGDNNIVIIWKNDDIVRTISRSIKKVSVQEYTDFKLAEEKRIEDERIRREEQARIEREKIEEEERTKKVEKQFSAWDGSHLLLKRYVIENLKDPDSFEHIDTYFGILQDVDWLYFVSVEMNYRAKNSFWGYVIWKQKAYFDIDWNPIKTENWLSL